MRQHKVRTGQVSVLASDINKVEEAVESNITDRLKAIVSKTGIKGGEETPFTFSYSALGGGIFQVSVSNLGPVIFPDRSIVSESENLSTSVTLAKGEEKTVYLYRGTEYSNDQTGNFKPGHPVDADGAIPPQGDYIESAGVIQVLVVGGLAFPDQKRILFGSIKNIDDLSLEFTDLRADNSVKLEDGGFYGDANTAPEGLEVESLYHHSLLQNSSSEDLNIASPHTNMSANGLYLNVVWDYDPDSYCYEVKLQPIDEDGNIIGYPWFSLVPAENFELKTGTVFPACEGVRYEVGVRSLSNSPSHQPGLWATHVILAGATKSMNGDVEYAGLGAWDPVPAPSFTIEPLYPDDSLSLPFILDINVTVQEQTPSPHFVQIFESGTPFQSAPSGDVAYEGSPGGIRILLQPGLSRYYAARVVGPGGICSQLVSCDTQFIAPAIVYPSNMPEEFVLTVPVSAQIYTTGVIPKTLMAFYPPAGDVKLKGLAFRGHGTRIDTTDPQLELKLQIAVTGTGVPMQDYARGKKLLCPGEIVLPDVPIVNSALPGKLEYNEVDCLKGIVGGPAFEPTEGIYILATAYKWDPGTTPDIYISGELTMIFEYGHPFGGVEV